MSATFLFRLVMPVFFMAFATEARSQPAQPKNPELSKINMLLQQWQIPVYYDLNDEPWAQRIQVSERDQMLYISRRPYEVSDSSDEWFVIHRVPLLGIDSISMNYRDSLLVFHVGGNRIGDFQMGSFKAASSSTAGAHMRLPDVRNLAGQLTGPLKVYQQEHKKPVPATARDLVANAVYDYLAHRAYNSQQVGALANEGTLYIGKCQICEGSRDAFRDYAASTHETRDVTNHTWDLRVDLFNGDTAKKMRALEKLVEEAVNDFYSNYHFSTEDIEKMRAMLAAQRKKSMGLAAGKKCASCDGACVAGEGMGNGQ